VQCFYSRGRNKDEETRARADFYQFAGLIDIKPEAGSHLIHSMSASFSEEEVDIEEQVVHNWLDHFKMHFYQVHASGHMSKDQLVEMVKDIQSKRAFSVILRINCYSKHIAVTCKQLNKGKNMN